MRTIKLLRLVYLVGPAAYLSTAGIASATDDLCTGTGACSSLSTGTQDTVFGYNAMNKVTSGSSNTAVGRSALFSDVSGLGNTAVGYVALYHATGDLSTAVGYEALDGGTSAQRNVAVGAFAAMGITSGSYNTAVGEEALVNDNIGQENVALGYYAANSLTTGSGNTSLGAEANDGTSSGSSNTAIGYQALLGNVTGSNNTVVGYHAQPNNSDYSNSGAFGANSIITASNQIVIGSSTTQTLILNGQSGGMSDARFKKDVKEQVVGLAFVKKLRPVTFSWDMERLAAFDGMSRVDPEVKNLKEHKRYTGFIAQEVEAAAKDASYDFSGVMKPENDKSKYALAYSEFVVPLVKSVQEQQQQIEQLQETVASLKASRGPQHASMFGDSTTYGAMLGGFLGVLCLKRRKGSRGLAGPRSLNVTA